MFFSIRSFLRFFSCISTIPFMCPLVRGWNMMMSSTLFRNSGLKVCLNTSVTLVLISS